MLSLYSWFVDESADNYDEPTGDVMTDINTSNPDDCIYYGCIFNTFPNYNSEANMMVLILIHLIDLVVDSTYIEFWSYDSSSMTLSYPEEPANIDNNTCDVLVVMGCTDSEAYNYEENANANDSCIPVVLF